MFFPTEFPCTAWYIPTNGAPKETTLTGWTNASKLWLYSTTRTLHAAQCFESPEAAVKAEIESVNAECMRLRKLLTLAEDKRCDAILLQAEISQKNNPKV